ncbi:uncharacterized protein ACJ7VT_007985 [Polymixia lowei]
MFTCAMNKASDLNSVIICQYALPLSLTFYFISFLLVMVYALKSKYTVQGWRASQGGAEGEEPLCQRSIVALPVYAIVWLIPIAVYLVYVFTSYLTAASLFPVSDRAADRYCTSCILFLHIWSDYCSDPEEKHDIVLRVLPFVVVIPVLVICSVTYYKVRHWYRRHEQEGLFPVEGDGRSRRRLRTMVSTSRNMIIVIFVCWAPAFLLAILSTLTTYSEVHQKSLFGLYVLQAATVSLQGFLNSVVYAWGRRNFTEAVLGESTPLMAHNRQAFFEESLKITT